MLIFLKLLSSSMMIVLITEIAKKHTILGGLLAVLPVNIVLALFWLYIEKQDLGLLANFSYSAFWGIFSTMFFLAIVAYLFSKQVPFVLTLFFGIIFITILCVFQNKLLNNMS